MASDTTTDDRRAPPPPTRASTTLVVVALAATSIGALLADLYGVTSMRTFTWAVTAPALAALTAVAARTNDDELRRRITVGAVGGLVGTIGYDVVRIPFAILGYRLFAPIDSYGLLISGQDMSSATSDTLGWLFHLGNGVTFGVMYAAVAARRHWGWGLLWGLVLESAVVFSPFRERYGLAGQHVSIAIAYGAHLAYGYPLGRIVQRTDATADTLRQLGRRPTTTLLTVAVAAIVLWQQPWHTSDARQRAGRIAEDLDRPTAIVDGGTARFAPEWLRIEQGGCIHLVNETGTRFVEDAGVLDAHGQADWCFDEPGVHRVHLGSRAYAGGFVYVDEGGGR